jgi:hypothetical protein
VNASLALEALLIELRSALAGITSIPL